MNPADSHINGKIGSLEKFNMEMIIFKLSIVVHNYNPTIQEAKAGRLLVLCQSDLHSKTLSKNMVIFSKLTYKFNTILMKIPAALEKTQKIATTIF